MTDSPLRKQLEGVHVDPPTTNEDDHLETDPIEDPDTSPAEGQDGKDEKKESDGRPPENWYREMVRKQEQFQERMQQQFLEAQERMAENFRSAPAQPAENSGDPLASKSVDELKALRSQVPDEQKQAFEEYIVERIANDVAEKKVAAFQQSYTATSARQQAAQEAVNRFPDLAVPTSEFARAAEAKLKKLGKGYIENNPRAVLDVANEVALEMGTSFRGPSKQASRRNPPGKPATSSSAPATSNDSKEDQARQKRLADIAKKLKAANGGKDFDMDRINESSKAYRDNIDLFLRK